MNSIKNKIIDRGAIWSPPVIGELQKAKDLPFCINQCNQISIAPCTLADEKKIADAPDGILFEIEVTFYHLADFDTGAVDGNILYENSSKVVVHKVDGKYYHNNAIVGAFSPNAILFTVVTDNVGLDELGITSFG